MSELSFKDDVGARAPSAPGDAQGRCVSRLLVGIFVPCPVAALVPAVFLVIIERDLLALIMYPGLLYIACIAGGLQFIVHSFLMEFLVWRVVGRNCVAVFVSALLGLLVGVSIWLMWREFLETCMYAGFVAGLVSGGILYRLRRGT